MRNLLLSVALWVGAFASLSAQKFCNKTIVYFETGQYELSAQAQAKLDALMQTNPGKKFMVELMGHPDAIDDNAANMRLSQNRAASVADCRTGHR